MKFYRRIQLIGNQLIINEIEWDDQGMYQCFLTNGVGEDTRSTWLRIKSKFFKFIYTLEIRYKNFFMSLGESPTVSVSNDLIVFNGTNVQLTCSVTGSPWPNITWFKCKIIFFVVFDFK